MSTIGPSTLIVFTNDGLGRAPKDLRRKLVVPYLTLLRENKTLPGAIAFYTRGVRLVCEGSPALELLQELEAAGVRILSCKTCLDYWGLTNAVAVGVVGGMGDIVSAQSMAEKVISV